MVRICSWYVFSMAWIRWTVPIVLLLGFVAYGLGIYFYVHAQRILGAARTSAYYAVAPFISVFLSLLLFRETPGLLFAAALFLMIIGAWLSSRDERIVTPRVFPNRAKKWYDKRRERTVQE